MRGITRRSKHLHSPVPRHLNRNVPRRAEAVKTQSRTTFYAREPQRPEPDDSRAKQRRGLFIGKTFGNRVDEVLGRDNEFGITAIHAVARERRAVAEILHASAAIFAGSVRSMQPGNAHARPDRESLCALAPFLNDADDLV